MYTLIRENWDKNKPLEVLVYENPAEAILEFNYYSKRLQNDEKYKNYRDTGSIIEKEYFDKYSGERWLKMKKKIMDRYFLIIGMLTNDDGSDKIFSILINGEIILTPEEKGEVENKEKSVKKKKEEKNEEEDIKEIYDYFRIVHKKSICDKCFKHFEVPDRGKNDGYGMHLKSICLKVRRNERDEKVFDMYGGYMGEILIKEDSNNEFPEGNAYCEYCVDIYDEEKFEVLWSH